MTTMHQPYDRKVSGVLRWHFVSILAFLVCVVPGGAQKSNSPTDPKGLLNGKHSGASFGALDASSYDAVNVGVQEFTGVMGLDASLAYTGGAAGSGHGAKALAALQKLMAKGSKGNMQGSAASMQGSAASMQSLAAGMSPTQIQVLKARGLGGLTQKELLQKKGIAPGVQRGIALSIQSDEAKQKSGAGSTFSSEVQPGPSSDNPEQESSPESLNSSESDKSPFESLASPDAFEHINGSFKTSQGASGSSHDAFEQLGESFRASHELPCGESCGLSGGGATGEGRPTTENLDQTLPGRLSRSANRLDTSRPTRGASERLFGQPADNELKSRHRKSGQTQSNFHRGSNDHQHE